MGTSRGSHYQFLRSAGLRRKASRPNRAASQSIPLPRDRQFQRWRPSTSVNSARTSPAIGGSSIQAHIENTKLTASTVKADRLPGTPIPGPEKKTGSSVMRMNPVEHSSIGRTSIGSLIPLSHVGGGGAAPLGPRGGRTLVTETVTLVRADEPYRPGHGRRSQGTCKQRAASTPCRKPTKNRTQPMVPKIAKPCTTSAIPGRTSPWSQG